MVLVIRSTLFDFGMNNTFPPVLYSDEQQYLLQATPLDRWSWSRPYPGPIQDLDLDRKLLYYTRVKITGK